MGGFPPDEQMNYLNVVLLLLAFVSGIAVVTQQNDIRNRHAELSRAEAEQQKLEEEFARLQLKQAELSNLRLVRQAAEKSGMVLPDASDTRVVEAGRNRE